MSVLVTDKGFAPVPEMPATGVADLAHTDDPAALDLAGLSLILLLRGALRRRKRSCGGDCGCSRKEKH